MTTEQCPTCGSAVRVAGDQDEGTMYYVPILTGAQVDAADRMAAYLTEAGLASNPAAYQDALQAAWTAATDYNVAGAMAQPEDADRPDDYVARIRAWVARFQKGE